MELVRRGGCRHYSMLVSSKLQLPDAMLETSLSCIPPVQIRHQSYAAILHGTNAFGSGTSFPTARTMSSHFNASLVRLVP